MIENVEQTIAEIEGYRLTIQLFGPELTHIALRLYAGEEEIHNNVSPRFPEDLEKAEQAAASYSVSVMQEVPADDQEKVKRLFISASAVLSQYLTLHPENRQ